MPARSPDTDPVVVVGGGLAGLAAAARLAKLGHRVELYEAGDRLGGDWASYPLLDATGRALPGVLVDDAPAVLGFPAPWRDLFRKSGRPLEAELARTGCALVPADPPWYRFADGAALVLPTDRGEQYEALNRAYGPVVAARWRDLLDGLDGVWQALRPLGLEAERPPGRPDRDVRRALWANRTVADVADRAGHPHLRTVVRSLAHRLGSTPERLPALAAVELTLARTFGRWQIAPTGDTGDAGRSSVLLEALVERLRLRKVTVHLDQQVEGVDPGLRVRVDDRSVAASAVVLAVDPWTAATLAPDPTAAALTRRLRPLRPAMTPTVSHALVDDPGLTVSETVSLDLAGVPVVRYRRPGPEGSAVESTHDFTLTVPRAAAGVEGDGWRGRGFRGWLARPGARTATPGLLLAGPANPAGPGPSQVVLSGALAAYAVEDA